MQHSNKDDFIEQKIEARKQYVDRKIAKWAQWSFHNKGKILYKELMEVIKEYNNNK